MQYYLTYTNYVILFLIQNKLAQSYLENYKEIRLSNVQGSVFRRIFNSRLNIWAHQYQVYVEAHAEFSEGMNTTEKSFVQQGLITHVIINN